MLKAKTTNKEEVSVMGKIVSSFIVAVLLVSIFASFYSPEVEVQAQVGDYVTNGGFESGWTGWTNNWGGVLNDTDPYAGSYCITNEYNGTHYQPFSFWQNYSTPIHTNDIRHVYFYYKSGSVGSTYTFKIFYTEGGQESHYLLAQSSYYQKFVYPDDDLYITAIQFYCPNGSYPTDPFQVDKVKITPIDWEFTEDFENWNEHDWFNSGTLDISSTAAYTGNYGMRVNTTSSPDIWLSCDRESEALGLVDFTWYFKVNQIYLSPTYDDPIQIFESTNWYVGWVFMVGINRTSATDPTTYHFQIGSEIPYCDDPWRYADWINVGEFTVGNWYKMRYVFKSSDTDGYSKFFINDIEVYDYADYATNPYDTKYAEDDWGIDYNLEWGIQYWGTEDSIDFFYDDITIHIEEYEEEPPDVADSNNFLYFRSDTWTVQEELGYKLMTENTFENTTVSIIPSLETSVSIGIRVWYYDQFNEATELTDGSPDAVATLSSTYYGDKIGYMSVENHFDIIDHLKVIVYMRQDSDTWQTKGYFFTGSGDDDIQYYIVLKNATWAVHYYLNYTSATNFEFQFGNKASCNSYIQGIIPRADPWRVSLARWQNQDIYGTITAPWSWVFGVNLFWTILYFGCITMLYMRHGSYKMALLITWILGGSGSILWAIIPASGLAAAALMLAFAMAGTLFKIFHK